MATPAMSIVSRRERALDRPHLARPDPRHRAVDEQQQPDRDDHDAQHGAALDRPHDVWWTATPPANDTSSVTKNAGQYGQPWFDVERPGDVRRERRHLALREVDHARSRGGSAPARARARRRCRPTRAPRRPAGRSRPCAPSVPQVAPADGLVVAQLVARPLDGDARPPRARRRRLAAASARRASCSTTSTASPSFSFSSRTIRKISRTTIGARPERGLVEHQQPRAGTSARGRARASAARRPRASPPCWSARRSIHGK